MVDKCPSCDRGFWKTEDFPRVYVAKVSIIKPGEVPDAIPKHTYEDLLEKETPKDVLAYFKEHPGEEELVHSDGFIYKIPFKDTKKYQELKERHELEESCGPRLWKRHHNFAPEVRKIIEDESLKQYLEKLKKIVGQEVLTAEIMPDWKQGEIKLDLEDSVDLRGNVEKINGYRVSKISLIAPSGDFMGLDTFFQEILEVGHIEYEGRLNKE